MNATKNLVNCHQVGKLVPPRALYLVRPCGRDDGKWFVCNQTQGRYVLNTCSGAARGQFGAVTLALCSSP